MKANDILDYVGKQIGVAPEGLPDGGFYSGTPNDPVHGILITWMANLEALAYAVQKGRNLVVCHEGPFFYEMNQGPLYRWTSPPDEPVYEREDHPNRRRKAFLEQARLTLLQIHYGLDRLCIFEDFASAMGLGKFLAGGGYEKIYQLPQPMRIEELARGVSDAVGMSSIRVAGDTNKVVERVGNLWGGVGLSSNRYWMRKQIELGAEVIVCGESDEDAMFFALEYGIPLIITSHVASENIGLRKFSHQLQQAFPHIPVEFYDVKIPFREFQTNPSSFESER